MHKLLVLYPRPVDPDAFIEYYRSTHLPLARQLPGLLAARFSTEVNAGEGIDLFAVFEADFADGAALAVAMASDVGRAVEADVPNYATGGATVINYPIEQV